MPETDLPNANRSRIVKLIPFKNAKTLNVIVLLSNDNCPALISYLDQVVFQYGVTVKYLAVNPNKTPIPDWILKDNIQVFNYSRDFNKKRIINLDIIKQFVNEEVDFLFTLADNEYSIIETLAEMSMAHFKIGRSFSHTDPYDMSIKLSKKDTDVNLAKEIISHLQSITSN